MSYDLAFLVREGENPPTGDSFRQHFRSRRGYKEQANQFWYQNEDTGVYFSFDLHDDEGGADSEEAESVSDGLKPTCLSFNMNYFRPHVFGLEAERELSALVARFSVLVDDPQSDGMARGAYSGAGFLRGWNAGNLFGHRAILSQMAKGNPPASSPNMDALPRETLENIWRWNYRRHDLQQDLGDDVFVPGIRLVRNDGGPRSFVVWGDAIPLAVPEVDLIVLVRDELAPRRLFGRKRDTCLVTWAALRPLLGLGRRVEGETPYTRFEYGAAPAPIVDFFRHQPSHAAKLEGLSADQVLTHEVIEEARRTSPRPEA
ncbi:MAG TPA: hypothetical protein VFK70_08075 [Vicinamibacteria bacterium]|nr:hypothetical protein [Vicinamibacteria bacterium]